MTPTRASWSSGLSWMTNWLAVSMGKDGVTKQTCRAPQKDMSMFTVFLSYSPMMAYTPLENWEQTATKRGNMKDVSPWTYRTELRNFIWKWPRANKAVFAMLLHTKMMAVLDISTDAPLFRGIAEAVPCSTNKHTPGLRVDRSHIVKLHRADKPGCRQNFLFLKKNKIPKFTLGNHITILT